MPIDDAEPFATDATSARMRQMRQTQEGVTLPPMSIDDAVPMDAGACATTTESRAGSRA